MSVDMGPDTFLPSFLSIPNTRHIKTLSLEPTKC